MLPREDPIDFKYLQSLIKENTCHGELIDNVEEDLMQHSNNG